MDIISLGKASKTIKEKVNYQSTFLGEGVEAHFSSLDERLDWLEGQYSGSQVQEIINILTENAKMENVEFVGGQLVLKHEPITHTMYQKDYATEGIYQNTIELGNNFISVAAQAFLKSISANQSASIQFEQSDDGITFDAPQEWSATAHPEKSFIRVTIKLISTDFKNVDYVTNVELEGNRYIENNLLIKSKEDDMTLDTTWTEEGSLHRKKITRDEWVRIDKMNVLPKE